MNKYLSFLLFVPISILLCACRLDEIQLRGDNQDTWYALKNELLSIDYVEDVYCIERSNGGELDFVITVDSSCSHSDIDYIFQDIVFPAFANNNDLLTMIHRTIGGPGIGVQIQDSKGHQLSSASSYDIANEAWRYHDQLVYLHDYLSVERLENIVVFDQQSELYDISESIRGYAEILDNQDEQSYIYEVYIYGELASNIDELSESIRLFFENSQYITQISIIDISDREYKS